MSSQLVSRAPFTPIELVDESNLTTKEEFEVVDLDP
jgi:hypothetical protein